MTIHHRPHSGTPIRVLIGACFALALTLLLFPLSASAHAINKTSTLIAPLAGPTMQVQAGFSSRYRDGNWTPIQVTLHNDGPDFTGKVSVNTSSLFSGPGSAGSTYIYQAAVNLPNGAQKQVTLYVPFTFGSPGITQSINVDLLDANNHQVTTQSTALRSLGASDTYVGFLSDQTPGLGTLTNVPLPNQNQGGSILVEPLSANTMPTIAAALKNFDVIIIDNFTTSSLNQDQLTALQNWVQQGGKLVAVGGPEWRHTLEPIANLLPVTLTGTATLPTGTHLFPLGGPTRSGPSQDKVSDAAPAPIAISTATTHPDGTVILSSATTPLMVQASQEQGQVYYLAFDPALDPLATWSGTTTLWKGVLTRLLGNQLLYSSTANNVAPGQFVQPFGGMETLLQSLFPSAIPSTWIILVLLLSYVAILGPVRFFLVRRFKNRSWSWRIILSTIVVFSLLSYGLALQQKGSSILSSSISVIQLSRAGTTGSIAHTSTYVGVFVPNNGDFQVHIPGSNLVQSTEDAQFRSPQGALTPQLTTITSTQDGTDVNLQGVDIWTLRSVVSHRDHPVSGGIISHLAVQNNTLTGTVTNTLSYGLSDVYLLMGNQFVSVGHLAAGESKGVNLTITNNPPATGTNQPSLADQITSSRGLSAPYSPYTYNNSSPNELQRRMAMLSTLSGEFGAYAYCSTGGVCYQGAISIRSTFKASLVTSGSITVLSGGGPQLTTADPLLIPGAAVTLIGWADHLPSDESNATVNGSYTTTSQEVFVQAPLDVNFTGTVNVPSSLITGRVVDIQNQGSTLQMTIPGVYQMTSGSANTGGVTFEYALPSISGLHPGSFTLTDPLDSINGGAPPIGPVGPAGSGQQLTIDHLHAYLYNWRTGTWDAFTFNQAALAVNNAQPYIGPNGRILLQLANEDDTQGTIIFSKPQLQLQGSVSS